MRYRYYMTMAMYPEESVMQRACLGKDTPPYYIEINSHRWEQIKVFNSHEEFEYWKEHHPDCHYVMSVDKIEEIE